MSRLKLIDFLKLIETDISPIEYNPDFDCFTEFLTSFQVRIQFGEDQYVKCHISSPILVPWYDEPVKAICPVSEGLIDVWIDSSGIRSMYSEYFTEVKAHESNN